MTPSTTEGAREDGFKPGLGRSLIRALLRHCPRCNARKVFASWFRLRETCPRCRLAFSREEGYWVGAIIINTAVTEVVFGVLFVATLVTSFPEVPWQPLLAVGLATNGLFPIFFHPYSKTLWVPIDLHIHPPSP
ncbi:MAG: DUF983 domain-containing protein [Actinomycetota bacterium]